MDEKLWDEVTGPFLVTDNAWVESHVKYVRSELSQEEEKRFESYGYIAPRVVALLCTFSATSK
jgi:hypothetical protein